MFLKHAEKAGTHSFHSYSPRIQNAVRKVFSKSPVNIINNLVPKKSHLVNRMQTYASHWTQ